MAGFGGLSGGTGLQGDGQALGPGVVGNGGSSGGVGVAGNGGASTAAGSWALAPGTGPGVLGMACADNGMHGTATAAGGVGVLAENTAGGTALNATVPAVFSRSGILTVAAGKSAVTKTGVALTAASLVRATLQQDVAGVWVRSAVPDVAGSSFTVHLSQAVAASPKVAWFMMN